MACEVQNLVLIEISTTGSHCLEVPSINKFCTIGTRLYICDILFIRRGKRLQLAQQYIGVSRLVGIYIFTKMFFFVRNKYPSIIDRKSVV